MRPHAYRRAYLESSRAGNCSCGGHPGSAPKPRRGLLPPSTQPCVRDASAREAFGAWPLEREGLELVERLLATRTDAALHKVRLLRCLAAGCNDGLAALVLARMGLAHAWYRANASELDAGSDARVLQGALAGSTVCVLGVGMMCVLGILGMELFMVRRCRLTSA